VLIITHHERLLVFNKPQKTHVILAGRIVETGDAELARQLHSSGYGAVRERHPDAAAQEKIALEKTAGKTASEKAASEKTGDKSADATSEPEMAAS